MNYLEVAQTLENFITAKGGKWDWDDYTSGTHFKDAYLRQLQRRVTFLDLEFPPVVKGQYCSDEGVKVLQNYVTELRDKAKEQTVAQYLKAKEVSTTTTE